MGKKKNKGITLIALVITIIILLILAGVTLITLVENGGILEKTDTASEENRKQTATEIMNLKITACQMKAYNEKGELPKLAYLAAYLAKDKEETGEIEYVEKASKKEASIDETNYADWDKLYTKLTAYPYEFEINSKLQLASINGVKIAQTEETVTIPKKEYDTLTTTVGNLTTTVERLEKAVENLTTTQYYDKSSFRFNTEYVDVDNSHLEVSRIGNVVNICFMVKLKKDLASDGADANRELISNLPIPKNKRNNILVARTNSSQKVEMCVAGSTGQLVMYWPSLALKSGQEINGSITYICE